MSVPEGGRAVCPEGWGLASIRELARRLGGSHGYVARVPGAGELAPGLDLVLRLTRTFGLSADRVLDED